MSTTTILGLAIAIAFLFLIAWEFIVRCANHEDDGPVFRNGMKAVMSGRITAQQTAAFFGVVAVRRGQEPVGHSAKLLAGHRQ